MQAYAALLAPFFGKAGTQNAERATSTFFVSWNPTISEIADAALAGSTQSPSTIEDLSCVERESLVPPSVLVPSESATYESSNASANCQVFIGDCAYAMQKVAIRVECYVDSIGTGPVLVMDRRDVGARTLMLLRPCAVRIESDGPICGVLWDDARGPDGTNYDSGSANPTAKLALEDAASTLSPASPPIAIDPEKKLRSQVIVCYYLAYREPRMGLPKSVAREIATIICDGLKSVVVKNEAGAPVLDCTVTAASGIQTARIRYHGSNTHSVVRQVWPNSNLVVTWATDCLFIACISRNRVSLERVIAPTRCSYTVSDPNAIARLSSAIPNLCDLASRLYPPDSSAAQLTRIMSGTLNDNRTMTRMGVAATPLAPVALGSILKGGPEYALRVGSVVTSPNGKWMLKLQEDSRLVIISRADPTQPHEIGSAQPPLRGKVIPVQCVVNDLTGAISLIGKTSAGSPATIVYWTTNRPTSSAAPPPSGTGSPPFELRMTDSGAAQVWGKYANKPLWSRSY